MLGDPDKRGVDEDLFEIEIAAEGFENALPDTPFCVQCQKRA
jgi:hypothetical protein